MKRISLENLNRIGGSRKMRYVVLLEVPKEDLLKKRKGICENLERDAYSHGMKFE